MRFVIPKAFLRCQKNMNYANIAIIADKTEKAQMIFQELQAQYNFTALNPITQHNADLVLVLGGDGFMLHCLHNYMHLNVPFYGINCGTVGFLLNPYNLSDLEQLINKAQTTITYPLEMKTIQLDGSITTSLAINEVSLFRKTNQAIKIKISVDNLVRLEELVCDGILLATPAGSTAYNSSVQGPILPMGSNILALTPISPFRPKKWSGAILSHTSCVELTVLDPELRKVNAVADFLEVSSVKSVIIKEKREQPIRLLFDYNNGLEERILKEQFAY